MKIPYRATQGHRTLDNYMGKTEEQITPQKKDTQRQTILAMLRSGPRHCGEFLKRGIAQYNARIKELREMGEHIVYDHNRKEFVME